MRGHSKAKKFTLVYFAVVLFLPGSIAMSQNNSLDCTKLPQSQVQLTTGDLSNKNHLQLSRKVAAGASVELDVCYAELTIKASKDDSFRISVDYDTPAPKIPADYLRVLDVASQTAKLQLYLPKHPRARVLIEVPTATPKLFVNLIHGEMSFETDRITGERKINIVFGHLDFLGNTDSYRNLAASVLMGSFHDHRPDGETSHGIISKSLTGTGNGSVDINVVKGSVDLKAWD